VTTVAENCLSLWQGVRATGLKHGGVEWMSAASSASMLLPPKLMLSNSNIDKNLFQISFTPQYQKTPHSKHEPKKKNSKSNSLVTASMSGTRKQRRQLLDA
jgi:hypothetical protein